MKDRLKKLLAPFLAAVLGTLLVLGAVRLVKDYQDFCTMRQWVAAVQQAQRDAAKQQPPAPANVPR